MDKNEKIKIFALYHENTYIFKNEVVQPLLTGSNEKNFKFNGLKDNVGDNISDKNYYYAELTGQYYVLKNYLKEHNNLEYVGFCHYRRFFDFEKSNKTFAFQPLNCYEFIPKFKKFYTQKNVYSFIKDYDIVIPHDSEIEESIYKQYENNHPIVTLNKMVEIVEKEYPEYTKYINDFLNGNKITFCLQFIMRTELFEEYFNWIYDLLLKLEKEIDITSFYKENPIYEYIKIPAYLAERFFNIWLRKKVDDDNLKVLRLNNYCLYDIKAKHYNFYFIKIFNGEHNLYIKLFGFIKIKIKKKKKNS